MHADEPLRLMVAGGAILFLPQRLLAAAALAAALLSPRPLVMTLLMLIFYAAWRLAVILRLYNIQSGGNTEAVIFPDGAVRLKCGQGEVQGGTLHTQHWSACGIAVLRASVAGKMRSLIILSTQQKNTDDFQRLHMWLRQNFCARGGSQQAPVA